MAPKYAKDMPVGFTNRIERVAIVGVSQTAIVCAALPSCPLATPFHHTHMHPNSIHRQVAKWAST